MRCPERRRRGGGRLVATVLSGTALAATGLAACGEDQGPFTVTGVTKPQYIADGDEICAEAERELRAASARVGRAPTDAVVERVAREAVIPVVERRIERLRSLEPPPGDEAEVDAIYDAAQDALDRLEANPALARSADQVFGKASRLAADYGFEDCAGT